MSECKMFKPCVEGMEVYGMQGTYHPTSVLDEDQVSQIAKEYIVATFGSAFDLDSLDLVNETWWARVRYYPEADQPVMVGRILIDSQSGHVVPLTSIEVQKMRERGVILIA